MMREYTECRHCGEELEEGNDGFCSPEHKQLFKEGEPWEICGTCEGEGTIVHPALSVWTGEDRDNDPDGFEEMMSGAYDVPCPQCHGSGKVRHRDTAAYRERLEDARTRGMESGDPELYYNPQLGLV